jgi:hypothetical protein
MGQPGGQAGLADATHAQEAYHTTVLCPQPLGQDRKFGLAPVKVRDLGCISPIHMGFALGRCSGCVGWLLQQVREPSFIQRHTLVGALPQDADFFGLLPAVEGAVLQTELDQVLEMSC